MKVLHIITGLNNGGAEGVLYRLVVNDKINEHIVISMMDIGKYGPLLVEQGIKVYCLEMSIGKLSLPSIIRLYRIIKKNKPDIVQTWMYHADLIGGGVARIAGVKKIFWNIRHSNFDKKYTKNSTIKIAKLCGKLSHIIPKKIICCAEGAVSVHTELGYLKDKFIIIGNGYDLDKFKIDNNARQQVRTNLEIGAYPVLGMVGRYDPQKNHKGLIEALNIVKKRGYRFDLVLVGRDLNARNEVLVKEIRELNLESQVHLLDQRNDIPDIMNALDFHILSSAYGEGFPNVIAEAMACGIPCIATDLGDSKVIIGNLGHIVSINNKVDLSNSIIKMLEEMKNKDVWDKYRDKIRLHIEENFGLDTMIKKYNSIWEI